ncbi:BatD family protein [Rickettsiaceae bacterium]|nr:BatD family protein [Rickettsiaceae bacterium]
MLSFFRFLVFVAVLIASNVATCSEFSSSVNQSKISQSKSIVLTLNLSDASAKSSPDLSKLKKDFDITGTSQYSNTTIINGKSSSTTGWNLTMKSKKTGKITIPSVTIDTKDGKLSTLPIQIEIVESAPLSSSDEESGIFVETSVSAKEIYQYQPFIFSVKLHTNHNVDNVRFEPLNLDNITVKPMGSYDLYKAKHQGESSIIAMHYLVTPLKNMKVTIPKLKVTGTYYSTQHTRFLGFFDSVLTSSARNQSIVNDEDDFTLQTKEIELDILPPKSDIKPWLPAESISMNENMDTGTFVVGKPISRSIITNAKGLLGKQLPEPIDISAHNNSEDSKHYKIYADLPEIKDDITKESINSFRRDSYTIIPQEAGKFTLPEITLKWWDVKNSKLVTSSIPAKTIEILANNDHNVAPKNDRGIKQDSKKQDEPKVVEMIKEQKVSENNFLLYLVIILSTIVVTFVIYKLAQLLKSGSYSNVNNKENSNFAVLTSDKKISVSDALGQPKKKNINLKKEINKISSTKELYDFLKDYANQELGAASNSSLHKINLAIKKQLDKDMFGDADQLIKDLESSLYSSNELDIENAKHRWLDLLKFVSKKKKNTKHKKTTSLPKLNP